MQRVGVLSGGLRIGRMIACALGVSCFAVGAVGAPPNVLVVLTDDQGWGDAGCYGAGDLHTPHLDGLAVRGLRFTQFYAAASVCSPSRAALLTGRYPQRCGVPTNVGAEDGLPPEEVTLAEVFRGAGYATGLFGKWHLGQGADRQPGAQGFDRAVGFLGGCIDNYSHFNYWGGPNRHDFYRDGVESEESGAYFPALMAEEAMAFMDAQGDRPFFVYWAANAPHYPYQGRAAWLARYRAAGVAYPRDLYGAFLSTLDEELGRLLAHLDARGLRERTIVVFQSDHGHSVEERAHFGGGSAGGLRGAKFSLFEGGIRVPAILSWPGRLPEGAVVDFPAHACDWFPTLLGLCGIAPPARELDGVNLVPWLLSPGTAPEGRVLHWQQGLGEGAPWAVRAGDWKLLFRAQDPAANPRAPLRTLAGGEEYFLVRLSEDVAEQVNLAGQHPEVVARLRGLHEDWVAGVGR
jgi:arylsulfatase A-like enzyme